MTGPLYTPISTTSAEPKRYNNIEEAPPHCMEGGIAESKSIGFYEVSMLPQEWAGAGFGGERGVRRVVSP
jgi:hypothetical protein